MANQSFTHRNHFPEISPPEQSSQDITPTFSELLLPEELSIDYITDTSNADLESLSDKLANHNIENATLFPISDNDIDNKIFDIDLIEIEEISKTLQPQKSPIVKPISISRPVFRRSGTYNIATASATVRIVNSPNIANKSFTQSADVKPTQATDFQDVKILDDLPAIQLPKTPNITHKIKQIPKINKNTVPETEPVKEPATDTLTNEVISSINIGSKKSRFIEENIDNLNTDNANFISGTSQNILSVETGFDEINSHFDSNSDDSSNSYSVKVNVKDVMVTDSREKLFDNLFYLSENVSTLGSEPEDKFFVQSSNGNILSDGADADQFWILNGQIPDSTNAINDF